MDDRQTKIREGAGLEDSRINEEFLDFLNKWSTPVLLTLAIAALVWAGLQYLERKKIARVDQAFSELAAATEGGNPSPASLQTIADEYEGVRSVSELALLTKADLYLNAFVMGMQPGAQISNATGLPVDESDMLTDDQRQGFLEQAGQLAERVLELSDGVAGKELIAMQAMTRLGAVDEGKRDFDSAKSMYQKMAALAGETHYLAVEALANNRIAHLESLNGLGALPKQSDLAVLPGEDAIPALPQVTQEQLNEMLKSIQENGSGSGEVPAIGNAPEPASDSTNEPAADPADQPADLPTGEPEGP